MKRKRGAALLLSAAMAFTMVATILPPDAAKAETSVGISMHRLYNPNSGEHLYTENTIERDRLISFGWVYEGIAWKAPISSNTPVYRLYNPNSGEHHYTKDIYEREHLISIGWKDEDIGWYSDDSKATPIYRLYNPNAVGQYEAGAHHYTKDLNEKNSLIAVGWRDEGIGWYERNQEEPPKAIQSVALDTMSPKVGNYITAIITPNDAEFTHYSWEALDSPYDESGIVFGGARSVYLDSETVGKYIRVYVTDSYGAFVCTTDSPVAGDDTNKKLVSVKIDNTSPKVGDSISAIITPSDAEYVSFRWEALDSPSDTIGTIIGFDKTVYLDINTAGKYIQVTAGDGYGNSFTDITDSPVAGDATKVSVKIDKTSPHVGDNISAIITPSDIQYIYIRWEALDSPSDEFGTSIGFDSSLYLDNTTVGKYIRVTVYCLNGNNITDITAMPVTAPGVIVNLPDTPFTLTNWDNSVVSQITSITYDATERSDGTYNIEITYKGVCTVSRSVPEMSFASCQLKSGSEVVRTGSLNSPSVIKGDTFTEKLWFSNLPKGSYDLLIYD